MCTIIPDVCKFSLNVHIKTAKNLNATPISVILLLPPNLALQYLQYFPKKCMKLKVTGPGDILSAPLDSSLSPTETCFYLLTHLAQSTSPVPPKVGPFAPIPPHTILHVMQLTHPLNPARTLWRSLILPYSSNNYPSWPHAILFSLNVHIHVQ